MKKKTLLCIDEFIMKGLYDSFVNKPFITLFKKYVDKEFKNINDFVFIAETYVKFIMQNKEYILKEFPNLSEKELKSDLNEIAMVVNRFKYRDSEILVKNYVKMIEYFINKKDRVLDVGAGAFPLSSIKLAKRNDNISAMDNFIVSDELIKRLNVNPIEKYFGYKTDISNFDYIIGLKPCYAIGSIVEKCKKENKPYFLHLCNCGASEYALSRFKMLIGDWKQILPEVDSDVKFANVYATNIDISQEKLRKIVYKKCKLTREMQESGLIDFMQGFSMAMQALAKGEEKDIVTSSGVISTNIVNCEGKEWKVCNDEISIEKE